MEIIFDEDYPICDGAANDPFYDIGYFDRPDEDETYDPDDEVIHREV